MKRILILAATTGYQTRAFAEAAGRIGFEAVLATDRCHVLDDPWGDDAIPVRFEAPEPSAGQVVRAAGGTLAGLVALGDRPTHIAALVASRLGLRYHPVEAVLAARNKYLARERFRLAGLPAPAYVRFRASVDPARTARHVRYPCVLKPLGLSASRGVIRANDEVEFASAFRRIAELLESPDIRRLRDEIDRYIQVEAFIPGREFALEGILTDGKLQPLALFDKPDPLDGPFFEETLYVTPSREAPSLQRQIVDAVQQATRALGLTHGPIHAEMRVNSEGVWMLEVAARPIGGLCSRALRFEPHVSLEEVILRHAAGEGMRDLKLCGPAAGVMMIPIRQAGVYCGVAGIDRAEGIPGVEEVIITAKQGQHQVPLPEASSYLGFIFARAGTPDAVETSLRRSYRELQFDIATALPLMPAARG
jgi:hypothetical protein